MPHNPNESKGTQESQVQLEVSPLFQQAFRPFDSMDSKSDAHERKEDFCSTAHNAISVLRAFQKENSWIKLSDDVFTYDKWPDTINWDFVFLKLQQLQVCSHNHVQLLLLAGIVINDIESLQDASDWQGAGALHYAACSGNPKAVEALIALGFDKDAKSNNGAPVLHYAARSGNPRAVEALIALGFDKDAKNNNGATVLHYAALSGNPKAVEALIALGFDKDAKNNNGVTALHYAAWSGNPKAVEALIALGFDKDAKNNDGATALHYAAWSGNLKAVEALIALGFDKYAKNKYGATVLHYAAWSGNSKAVEALIALGFDKDAKNNDGATALHYAALSGNSKAVEALIALGFDKYAKNKYGATVLHYAARSGNPKAVEALIALGFDKGAIDNNSNTVLHDAAWSGSRSMMTMLIEQHGLKPDAVDKTKNDILYWATLSKHQEAIDFCTDTTHTKKLYRNYWASFIAPSIPYEAAIPVLAGIIGEYATPTDDNEQLLLENGVRAGVKKRDEILTPLINFCNNNTYRADGRRGALNELLAPKKLDIIDLERRLDYMLEDKSYQNKPYSYSLLECRFNTGKITGNPPKDTANNFIVLEQKLKSTNEDFRGLRLSHQGLQASHQGLQASHQGLQASHQGLQATHQRLQANFGFQYKLLIALSLLSITGLAIGAWAASDAGQDEAEGVLITAGVVATGLFAYSIYKNQRARASVENGIEDKHAEAGHPAAP